MTGNGGLRADAVTDILRAHISKGEFMKKVNVTCRLDSESVAFLDTLGAQLDRDRSYLIKNAVSRFIDVHRWQIEEIKQGIAEADRGEFVSEADMEASFARWTRED